MVGNLLPTREIVHDILILKGWADFYASVAADPRTNPNIQYSAAMKAAHVAQALVHARLVLNEAIRQTRIGER